ncbi:lichenicidin A2 family type 2 lantibiotic [Leuconostoc citreum]|uniref:lichenicidin A2 family type 2 lantibiotic n=1 Tax=Leuconostoc citreum TaxID=33964 RepID=UPI000BFEC083|nr:lichenicidin A2 family type 2 lantibiotic [Leuconostoc citreum]
MSVNDIVGQSFHDMTEEEMINIVGGNTVTPDTTPVSPATVSFVASFLASAVVKCGKPRK